MSSLPCEARLKVPRPRGSRRAGRVGPEPGAVWRQPRACPLVLSRCAEAEGSAPPGLTPRTQSHFTARELSDPGAFLPPRRCEEREEVKRPLGTSSPARGCCLLSAVVAGSKEGNLLHLALPSCASSEPAARG